MIKSLFILSLLVVFGCAHKKTVTDANSAAAVNTVPDSSTIAGTKKAEVKKAATSAASVNCSSKKETRTIAVVAKEAGCETVYSKGTNVQSIANAKSDMSYCEKKLTQIRENLEKSGWKCE